MTKKFIAILATLPVATLGVAGLALADGDVIVSNYNDAYVQNVVVAGANTGWNTANGGNGGDAGNGGSDCRGDLRRSRDGANRSS